MTIDQDNDWPGKIAILGVGLLGGSVALSLRRARPAARLVGWARDQEKCDRLVALGIVDDAHSSLEKVCQGCDVVVVALPVDRIADLVVQAAQHTDANCLITDVGSTKVGIVSTVADHSAARDKFVAAHPIAGSEKSGADHAREDLFDEKLIVLTPTSSTPANLLRKAEQFWRLTGGSLVQMSATDHDTHLAAVSHVPHLVSALIARLADSRARPLVGSGWRDITRVAAGDPTLWTAICQENRKAIRGQLAKLADELAQLIHIIDRQDDRALWSWLEEAKRIKQQE